MKPEAKQSSRYSRQRKSADRENVLGNAQKIHAELPVSAVHYPVLDNIGSFTCVQGG